MPAMTLGLAEVEERLHVLRRRLNTFTAQHGIYLSLSALILLTTVLIVTGLWASALAFRIATWGAVGVAVCALVWCPLFLRRRWLDVTATAHLADQRAQLTDRLATLNDLRLRPRSSRLAPVLVAQTLALGARWQPRQVAPRRVPRSVFVLAASALALASTAFMSRPAPPPAGATGGIGAASEGGAATGTKTEPAGGSQQLSGASVQVSDEQLANGSPSGDMAEQPDDAPSRPQEGEQPGERIAHPLAALPDQLQQAIRRAFHAEAMDQPRQLAARSEKGDGGGTRPRDDAQGERDAQRRGDPDPKKPGGQSPEAENPGGTGAQQQSGKQPGESKRDQSGQRTDPNAPDRKFDGPAPAAGAGSNPGGLMNAQAGSMTPGQEGPKTFKLTITSFLRAMEQKGNQPHQPGKRVSAAGAVPSVGGGQGILSDRQLNDDALRKAEIPPEYEDIVRRVYSSRTTPQ